MEFKPHDYQQYAIEYIETHEVAAVLLDMGLGKTAITLTALYDLLFDYFEITRVLVIAPLRVARNTWPQEIEKWDHLKDIRYSVAVGTKKERLEAFRRDADIYIINRENVQWMVENVPFEFDAIVVDELSSFKNWNSKRFKSLMKVLQKLEQQAVQIADEGAPQGKARHRPYGYPVRERADGPVRRVQGAGYGTASGAVYHQVPPGLFPDRPDERSGGVFLQAPAGSGETDL